MTRSELQELVRELLDTHFQQQEETRKTFIGVQGENVIVMQSGAPHFGIAILPATAEVVQDLS